MKRQADFSAQFMKKMDDVLTRGGTAGCSSADFAFGDTSVPQPRPSNPPLELRHPLTARQQRRLDRNSEAKPSISGNKSPSLPSTDEEVEIEEVDSSNTWAVKALHHKAKIMSESGLTVMCDEEDDFLLLIS
ncbi:hypothetical protein Bca4012_083427 [Brassica carinata]